MIPKVAAFFQTFPIGNVGKKRMDRALVALRPDKRRWGCSAGMAMVPVGGMTQANMAAVGGVKKNLKNFTSSLRRAKNRPNAHTKAAQPVFVAQSSCTAGLAWTLSSRIGIVSPAASVGKLRAISTTTPESETPSSSSRVLYPFSEIEKKWQQHWEENSTFAVSEDAHMSGKEKFYVLDMFPYPSGSGLHVGHPEGYTATDITARYKRMLGQQVRDAAGWQEWTPFPPLPPSPVLLPPRAPIRSAR